MALALKVPGCQRRLKAETRLTTLSLQMGGIFMPSFLQGQARVHPPIGGAPSPSLVSLAMGVPRSGGQVGCCILRRGGPARSLSCPTKPGTRCVFWGLVFGESPPYSQETRARWPASLLSTLKPELENAASNQDGGRARGHPW